MSNNLTCHYCQHGTVEIGVTGLRKCQGCSSVWMPDEDREFNAGQPSEWPWGVNGHDQIRDASGQLVANTYFKPQNPGMRLANAQLIASAPTLKAENKALREAVEEYREMLEVALAACRKRGVRIEVTTTEGALLHFNDLFNPILAKARGVKS